MEKPLVFRDYQPGDEHQIMSLFRLAFRKEMSDAFWRRRFLDNPSGTGIIKMAFDAEKLVGHISVIPMKVQFQGELLPAIFPMTAMTHPEYGGRGIITCLLRAAYDTARESGFVFAYGFFNDNVLKVNVERLGYRNVIKMGVLEKKLAAGGREGSAVKNITQVESFDDSVNHLWDRVKESYRVIVPRTRGFLNWRFVRYSGIDYPKFVFSDGGGDSLGYIVLKIYVEGNTARGHIVDLLSVPDEMVLKPLIHKALHYFNENGIPEVSCWMMDNSLYTPYLLAEGFLGHLSATNFGARLLNEGDTEHIAVEKSSNWHLTMGDSDVF